MAITKANDSERDYGSFKDSLRAPIHRWFTYPAGYSHRLVENKAQAYGLNGQHCILDPFVGTGTTSVAAKSMGVNSIGIEAHPFVCWVAKTKMRSNLDVSKLEQEAAAIVEAAQALLADGINCEGVWPDLVYKCFAKENLNQLLALRTAIQERDMAQEQRDFFKVALTATLRDVTTAGAGWPYIAPSKHAKRKVHREAIAEFWKRLKMMLADIIVTTAVQKSDSQHRLINGDARSLEQFTGDNSIDMVLTSPPYLNNYDYADRTRLETYFWGIYDSWGDITHQVRDRLIVAATTQIRRNQMADLRDCPNILEASPRLHGEIVDAVQRLSELRHLKKGKKSYDIMVAGYFEDMLQVIKGVYKVLKPGQPFILVLGDSAPYGIHIRTDEIIAELALAVGFSDCNIQIIRTRGDKWAGNSQRHKVPLRESIVTILK